MSDQEQKLKIQEAKDRPMLHWIGKKPLDYVTVYPVQETERFDPDDSDDEGNLLFHGDSKDTLAWLIANGYRGKIDLVYIDPPFDSGADYVRRVKLRGVDNDRIEGEGHTLAEQIQYTDIWARDTYLQFMYERLTMLKELLSKTGSIYLHCDWHKGHLLRVIMDEIFGPSNFRNEIIWAYHRFGLGTQKNYTRAHDTILWYVKSQEASFNLDDVREPYSEKTMANFQGGISGSGFGAGELNPRGKIPEDFWIIAPAYKSLNEVLPFPTQKPEALLEKIILGSSDPGDLVLDCFVGSGTTPAVAQKLGRQWIAADINKGAIQTTSRRLQTVIQEQLFDGSAREPDFINDESAPTTFSFTHYRVNDYDLALQHDAALNLAVEHIGIERTRSDAFFEGKLGPRLVKVVPFTHPITPLDLEQVVDELKARNDERNVVVVGLGKELAVDQWLEDYNRRRPINRIELIELRTDEKYGKFFIHQPAQAEVSVTRQDGRIVVDVEDFISPTIVERLEMDTPLFRAQIPDWRSMVDVILIDTDYDGDVFDITLSDVPERKDDLVQGHYELPAPGSPTTVAVKIIDMLGEEVLVVEEV